MKKLLKYLGVGAAALLLVGLLLLLTPAATGTIWGSAHIDLKEPANGFVMIFGGQNVMHGQTGDFDVETLGVGVTAFVFLLVSLGLTAFISVNNLLKKPLIELPFPVFWSGLFVTGLVAAILFFVAQGKLVEAQYDVGPAFVLAAVMSLLVALVAACRVVLKVVKKA